MAREIKEYGFFPNPADPDYGLLFVVDENTGERFTLRGDPEAVKMVIEADKQKLGSGLVGGEWEERPGWPPDDWTEWGS